MSKLKPTVRLSKVSKLDGNLSWSLQALDTCPGSKGADGKLVPACSGCYATDGLYHMSTVIEPRKFNQEDWKRPEWVADMVQALTKSKFFRWFDSGDMYSLELAEKMLQVMELTPNTKHWLPTRMGKFFKFQAVIAKMQSLPNVMVRFSSDSIMGEFTPGVHGSTIVNDPSAVPAGATLCRAYENAGKCSGCRACWDKSVAVIAYPTHGRKMAKVIKIALAA
jgi:hypothetical protein